MSVPMKLSFQTLPDPVIEPGDEPKYLKVSHVVTIGDRQSISLLQTTSEDAVSDWLSRLDATTSDVAGEIVAGLNLFTESYKSKYSETHVALIVLCVGSSCLFYYNPFSLGFCNAKFKLWGSGVAKSFKAFCARPSVKLICTGPQEGVGMLAKCGLEFGQPPVMLQQLVQPLLSRFVKLEEECGDAVTTAIWGRPVVFGEMAGTTYDNRWTGSSLCEFVLKAYIAAEVGKIMIIPLPKTPISRRHDLIQKFPQSLY